MFKYAVEETNAAEFAVESHHDLEAGVSEHTPADGEIAPSTRVMDNAVSLSGLEAMISVFVGGIGEYSHADMVNLFKLVDSDRSGYIEKDEFDHFIDLATGDRYCTDATALKMTRDLERNLSKRKIPHSVL